MIWFIYAPVSLAFRLLCYIVNPLVVLFADSTGNLPRWMSWFQTPDNSLDNSPTWVAEHWSRLRIKYDWPIWRKRLYRYLQRVAWLYRNTGYGFNCSVLAYGGSLSNLKTHGVQKPDVITNPGFYFAHDQTASIWRRGWCLFGYWRYGKSKWYLRIYLGWKFHNSGITQRMFALHLNPFRRL
jgi:hypothetical protein